MLIRLKELEKFTLHATDGEIGSINRLYFDPAHWQARYLVVSAGWIELGRQVLISIHAVRRLDVQKRRLEVSLTQEQIRNAPPAILDVPLSRDYEREMMEYYGLPIDGQSATDVESVSLDDTGQTVGTTALNLANTDDLLACRVQAADADAGHLHDLLLALDNWRISAFVVEAGHWWSGREYALPVSWVNDIDWNEMRVDVPLPAEKLKAAPALEKDARLDDQYEAQLEGYYGVPETAALSYDDRIGGINAPAPRD